LTARDATGKGYK